MKLNFFNLLTQKETSSDEIAQEIVLLEKKIAEHKEQEKQFKEEGRSLRARQLCGEAVSADEVRNIKERLDQVEEDLAVFTKSHEKLSTKLIEALKKENKQGLEEWQKDKNALKAEEKTQAVEIMKLKVRVLVLEEMLSESGRGLLTTDEYVRLGNVERRRIVESLPRPTCFDKSVALLGRHSELRDFNEKEAFDRILNQYRKREVQPAAEVAVD